MVIDYEEKRRFARMTLDCDIDLKPSGTMDFVKGTCRNLSVSGIMFTTDTEITPGTMVDINITPRISVVPPLDATVEVIRVESVDPYNFNVAAVIKEMR